MFHELSCLMDFFRNSLEYMHMYIYIYRIFPSRLDLTSRPVSRLTIHPWITKWLVNPHKPMDSLGGWAWVLMEKHMDYPLVMTNIAIENGPVEIVIFPIHNGDLNHSHWWNFMFLNPVTFWWVKSPLDDTIQIGPIPIFRSPGESPPTNSWPGIRPGKQRISSYLFWNPYCGSTTSRSIYIPTLYMIQ